MIKIFVTIFLFASSLLSFAQEWHSDLDVATEIAQKENKSVLLVFQGSDWCGPCKILDKNVWETEAFKSYAKENLVLVKADFPRKKKNRLPKEQQEKNNKLAASYNPNGYFPLVVVFNSDKKVIGKTGYKKMETEEYIQHLNSFIQ